MPASVRRPSQSESVSVLLFKGNLPARGLEVPLRWVSQFGFLLSVMAAVTLVSSYLAVRFYRASLQSQPARLYELENQLADLRNAYELLKSQQRSLLAAPTAPTAPVASAAPQQVPEVATPVAAIPIAPAPQIQAQTPPPVVPAVAPALPAENWALALVTHLKKDLDQPSIKLQTPKFQWQGVTLKIKAAFQYIKTDGRLQQGKFMFVARGPELLVSHPRSALHPKNKTIVADRGETFSVARHRDVNAELGPISQSVLPTEIHLLVFNKSGALILEQALNVPPRTTETAQPPAEPAAAAEPQ